MLRYDWAMLLLAAAAIAAATPPTVSPAPTRAVIQARATVRIVSAARLRWDQQQSQSSDIPAMRTAVIQTVNGPQQARLIEFE